jgi:hypothetical protein
MRAGTRCVILILMPAIAPGCVTPLTVPPSIILRVADGPVWLRTEEIGGFRCEHGLLVCDDAVGRLSQRRCRCLE